MSHIEITLESPDEEAGRECWIASAFMIDNDGESGDSFGAGWADTPKAALIDLAEHFGDTMLCAPGNPWCEYSEEHTGPDPWSRTETICLVHHQQGEEDR